MYWSAKQEIVIIIVFIETTMNKRQEELFLNIIHEYTDTAQPVGSRLLVDKFEMGVSPATIRNDMVELEREGLIYQPHTSAGRVPTQDGYKSYINNYLKEKEPSQKEKTIFEKAINSADKNSENGKIKNIAKVVAEIAGAAVIVGFSQGNVYYTGVSNLLSQPEFADLGVIYNLSATVDQMDAIVEKIYNKVGDVEIRVADKNYFSDKCSSILSRKGNLLLGIVGPVRMDYGKNLGLINYIRQLVG